METLIPRSEQSLRVSLFFKSAPEKEYVLLCQEVEARCVSLAQQKPGIEAYKALMIVWREQMEKRGQSHLSGPMAGSEFVKYPAVVAPLDSITLLGQLIALHTIRGFRSTKYYVNLNLTLGILISATLEDSDGLNRVFREQNPLSYDELLKEYDKKPFDKESMDYVSKLLSTAAH